MSQNIFTLSIAISITLRCKRQKKRKGKIRRSINSSSEEEKIDQNKKPSLQPPDFLKDEVEDQQSHASGDTSKMNLFQMDHSNDSSPIIRTNRNGISLK